MYGDDDALMDARFAAEGRWPPHQRMPVMAVVAVPAAGDGASAHLLAPEHPS